MGIGYSIYHMHRRRDLYGEDAAIFRPERWEGSKLAHIGWGYLPFNGGPRTCLGSELSHTSELVGSWVWVFTDFLAFRGFRSYGGYVWYRPDSTDFP